jgi:hypothetical protein
MIRRSLFFGLTLILILAFALLSIRGCQQQEEPAGRSTEIIKQSESSATRVLKPQDLEIIHSKIVLERSADAEKSTLSARHEIEIFNRGSVPFQDIRLKFVYTSRAGGNIETKDYSVSKTISPGSTLKLTDIMIGGLPKSAADARVTILFADIANARKQEVPHN